MGEGRLAALVGLFKRCLETGDAAPFLDAAGAAGSDAGADRAELAAFVRAERARLGKLRTLGLTQGYEAKIAMIDQVLMRFGGSAPGRSDEEER